MSRADRRWRPSDADRDRYASAISQAFAEGRIDAADMESRTALVHEAKSIADLDALVDDMPPPVPAHTVDAPAPERQTRRMLLVVAALVFGAIVLSGIIGAVLINTLGGDESASSADPVSADPPPAAEAPPPVPVPEEEPPPVDIPLPGVETEQPSLYAEDGLVELWAAAAGLVPSELTLFADRAALRVRADSGQRALDTIEYGGGLLYGREPYRDLSDGEPDDEVFFSWSDVTPQAVAAAITGMPAAMGVAEVPIQHISIDNDGDDGVTINVYPDGDIGATYVKWDATGEHIIDVY